MKNEINKKKEREGRLSNFDSLNTTPKKGLCLDSKKQKSSRKAKGEGGGLIGT